MWKIKIPNGMEEEWTLRLYEKGWFSFYIEEAIEQITTDEGYSYQKNPAESSLLFLSAEEGQRAEDAAALLEIFVSDVEEAEPPAPPAPYENVELGSGWTLVYPPFQGEKQKKEIRIDPQGAFGTGVHMTTRDALSLLAGRDFTGMAAADIGTGSGILAVTAALKGAAVDAFDIQPVSREVSLQADLNGVKDRIRVFEQNILETSLPEKAYDLYIINIGAAATKKWLKSAGVLPGRPDSVLLVSGIVDWAEAEIRRIFGEYGFYPMEHKQTKEWHTFLFAKGERHE
ncbi:50S ribosomal protein L11 methyltransferase [Alteribacillus sp. HJP-4]|uniref:50S ribosomal protein L11 methyltransferase n=1 Tax=Alteribacillus sp. HJP-4 TaxID=2775394 RepID=UPI0035CCEFC8